MKAIKMLGLVASMALLAMAFAGATSAMAESTSLCGGDAAKCQTVAHIHETSVGGTENKAVLLTSIGNTECNVLFLGDVTASGAPLKIKGTFTYTNCKLGGSSCTATEENGPTELEVLKTGEETAEVTGKGLVHVVCSGFIDCSYNGTGLKGTAKGPLKSTQANGEVTLSEQATTKEAGGFLCPKTAKLDITTTPLTATYIKHPAASYCVKTEHTNGIYTDAECKTLGSPNEHKYTYTLIDGPAGGNVGNVWCYEVLKPYYGLWEVLNKVTEECEKDDVGKPTTSPFEKGTIVTVE